MAGERTTSALLLVASITGALVITGAIYLIIQQERARVVLAQRPPETIEVPVAAVDIPAGTTIRAEHIRTLALVEAAVPPEAILSGETIHSRVARERILQGEFLREERLAHEDAGTGLTALVPRGKRGFQVEVKNGNALSGFLRPGNYVDLIVVCPKSKPPDKRTLLEGVSVLGVNDQLAERSSDDADNRKSRRRIRPSATLALRPEEAELVKHASAECEVTLTLRNDTDISDSRSGPSDEDAPTPGAILPPRQAPDPLIDARTFPAAPSPGGEG